MGISNFLLDISITEHYPLAFITGQQLEVAVSKLCLRYPDRVIWSFVTSREQNISYNRIDTRRWFRGVVLDCDVFRFRF